MKDKDLSLLRDLLDAPLKKHQRRAVEEAIERLEGSQPQLTLNQRNYFESLKREHEPDYINAFSNGGGRNLGRPVPTPKVLLNRPLKPPGRA